MALDPTNLDNFELLSNMQGNIIKGHGREHTTHIFVHFDANKKTQAKELIKGLAEEGFITSAQKQLRDRELFKRNGKPGGLFASFYLSASGYKALDLLPPPDDSFNIGMKNIVTQKKLQDPALTKWEKGYQEDIHAMLLLAHNDEDEMAIVAKEMLLKFEMVSRIVHIEYGNAIRNANGDGLEHFGYVDGVSQPLFLQDEVDDFKKGKPEPLIWDPEADIDLVLVPDLSGSAVAMGSYFVFRKLEQKVKSFKMAEEALAGRLGLGGEDAERAGAMLVGRYEDGTPLTLNKKDGIIGSGIANNFDYQNDAAGAKCPFHAHVRKTNPRGAGFETLQDEKMHRMARRGIPYGKRHVSTELDPLPIQMPDEGVGLLFMSYQADISKQFEFIQQNWVNNPDFPALNNGSDPILGQGTVSEGVFAKVYDNASSLQREKFESFVTMKGGEYFFAPSIAFLQSLH